MSTIVRGDEMTAPARFANGNNSFGMRTDEKRRLLFLGVIAVAAALRIPGLTGFPFEQDEIYTTIEGTHLFDSPLNPGIEGRPLFFLLQHVLMQFLPTTHLAMRIVPFLFGTLGVWLTGRFAARVWGGNAGIIAALLVAIAPWHLHASAFARYWSLLYLLAVLFFYALWRAYQSNDRKDYALALIPLVLGSATHPSFVIGAFGVSVGMSLLKRDGRVGLNWPTKSAWIYLWAPYLALVLVAAVALRATNNSSAFQNWGGRGMMASLRLIPAVVEWLTPIVVVAAVLGAVAGIRSQQLGRRWWSAMTLIGAAVALMILMAASTRTDVYADYAMPILPLIFISAAGLIAMGVELLRKRVALVTTCAVLIMVAGVLPHVASHLSSGTRFDYRPAFDRVRQAGPQQTMVIWPQIIALHYAPDLKSAPLRMRVEVLDSILTKDQDIWVVGSARRFGLVVDEGGKITRWLHRHCVLDSSFEKPRWDYRLYRVELYRCSTTARNDATAARSTKNYALQLARNLSKR